MTHGQSNIKFSQGVYNTQRSYTVRPTIKYAFHKW